jgi:hypothetical protein
MEHHVLLVEPTHEEAGHRAGQPTGTAARSIFVRTKLGADRVASQLRESGIMAGPDPWRV